METGHTSVWSVQTNADQLLKSIVPSLNDLLLQHNGELTAYVRRLSAERQHLHVSVAELQQKLSAIPPVADTQVQQVFFLLTLSLLLEGK